MLSYQHIYHAGNLADVQKHALLAVMLDYLTQKPKPLSYIETHAGRGVYDLGSDEARKTGEARAGISAVSDWFGADHPYFRALKVTEGLHGAGSYPGSPAIAEALLRPEDRIHLAELHPQEHAALVGATEWDTKVYNQDGFEMGLSICPPTPRRGAMLIDPSYEIKDDYRTIPQFISNVHKRWNVGVIALWYPILSDGAHKMMIRSLNGQKLPKVLNHEVTFPPAREGHRMIGSGMYIINTPWGLSDEAERLSQLFKAL